MTPWSSTAALPWVRVAPDAPYFETEDGQPFTPVGQNDAVTWPDLKGLYRRRDLPGVEANLRRLQDAGVTVLRLMLEYAEGRTRYFEDPAGVFNPHMVQLWDDLFALCERLGLRILLTPYDTFWTWIRWEHHPYNRTRGGPLDSPGRWIVCAETQPLILERLRFAATRWGGSGALFAWDLWNELHPAHAEGRAEPFMAFIAQLSATVRETELRHHGRAHLQTVSLFGPELDAHPGQDLTEPFFRHPDLDFASLHIYGARTIDNPKTTVAAAVDLGRVVARALGEIRDGRPFLDTEHGPIHAFKDRQRTLPAAFDDEYFRHMQWAHLASGGAGGGMRWPNRHPHTLTPGMRRAQKAMADFLPEIDWRTFRRRHLGAALAVSHRGVQAFGCGDPHQALVYLLRDGPYQPDGRLDRESPPLQLLVRVPGLAAGCYRATFWDTEAGRPVGRTTAQRGPRALMLEAPPFARDLAIALRAEPQTG